MRVLLTGANGQIGSEIARQANIREHSLTVCYRTDLDITDAEAVHRVIMESDAQVVINAAAYTAVDQAEKEPKLAYAVNRDGPYYLALVCHQKNIPLLHLSTDYVFSGEKPEPYQENDVTAPLGVYGDSKWQGEQCIRQQLSQHLILRVSWVFGQYGNNFVKTVLRLAREREQLKIVADQYGCPTYAADIAAVLLTLAEKVTFSRHSAWGTYHYCGLPVVSWHEFAEKVLKLANNYETLIANEAIPITTAEYPTLAQRPVNSVLDSRLLQETFDIAPRFWQEGLAQTLQALTVGGQ